MSGSRIAGGVYEFHKLRSPSSGSRPSDKPLLRGYSEKEPSPAAASSNVIPVPDNMETSQVSAEMQPDATVHALGELAHVATPPATEVELPALSVL